MTSGKYQLIEPSKNQGLSTSTVLDSDSPRRVFLVPVHLPWNTLLRLYHTYFEP